jgi:hypothetical protein
MFNPPTGPVSGKPVNASIDPDSFSVRWEGQVQAQYTQTYTFITRGDDGVRLWVNGQQLVDNWTDHPTTEDTGTIDLVAGTKYDIKMEYYEGAFGAEVQLLWQSASTPRAIIPQSRLFPSAAPAPTPTPVPAVGKPLAPRVRSVTDTSVTFEGPSLPANASTLKLQKKLNAGPDTGYADVQSGITDSPALIVTDLSPSTAYTFRYVAIGAGGSAVSDEKVVTTTAPGTGKGLTGQYFDNSDLTNLGFARLDSQIDFHWNDGSPHTSLGNGFSVRWKGKVEAKSTDNYTFYLGTRNRGRLWINNQLILNGTPDPWAAPELSGQVSLVQGTRYNILIEIESPAGGGSNQLLWSSSKQIKEVVPQRYLHPLQLPGTGQGLRAHLYQDKELLDFALSRIDPMVNFRWEAGAPDSRIEADTFSARWSGQIQPLYSETYTFHTETDDGVRLRVDGQLLVDGWAPVPGEAPVARSGTITLVAGQRYDIEMQYFDNTGRASAKLFWQSASQPKEIIPAEQLYASPVNAASPSSGTGLRGFYYRKQSFDNADLVLTRLDPRIDFNWTTRSPAPSIPWDRFNVRWKGQLQPLRTEPHVLYLEADTGVRLRLNGQTLVDSWVPIYGENMPPIQPVTLNLVAGQRYDLEVDYYEQTGNASVRLLWSSPSQVKQVIPASQLFPAPVPAPLGTGTGLRGDYYNHQQNLLVNYDENALPPYEGITAEYYVGPSTTFADLRLSRVDPTVNFAWLGARPDRNVQEDFSVRWQGWVQPLYSEEYTFSVASNGGAELTINGEIMDFPAKVVLEAGQKYSIKLQYSNVGPGAMAKLFWKSESQQEEIVPRRQLYPAPALVSAPGTGNGLRGIYYDSADQSENPFDRIDATVDFDWGLAGPTSPVANLNADTFAINWMGSVEARYSELYTFYVNADEGARLWVDGQLIADPSPDSKETFGSIYLTAGRRYSISLEYYEHSGPAHAQLLWSSPSQVKQLVPQTQLYSTMPPKLQPYVEPCEDPPVGRCPCPPRIFDSSFVRQSIPTKMSTNGVYPVSVTMTNTGTGTWTNYPGQYSNGPAALNFHYGDRVWQFVSAGHNMGTNAHDDYILPVPATNPPGIGECEGAGVAPSSSLTFNFTIRAPSVPGDYVFRSSMNTFGDPGPPVRIRVTAPEPVPAPIIEAVGSSHVRLKTPALPLRHDKFRIERALGPSDAVLPPPSQGLKAWLRGDAIRNTASGAVVEKWFDISGNGHHATQSVVEMRPKYIAQGLNGRPLVRFDSRGTVLDKRLTTQYQNTGGSEMTLFLVAKSSYYAGVTKFLSGETSHVAYPRHSANNVVEFNVNNEEGSHGVDSGFINNEWNIGAVVWKSGTANGMRAYRDGILKGSRDTGPQLLKGGLFQLSPWRLFDHPQNCDIAEVLVYDRALSDVERQAVELYLSRRYGRQTRTGDVPPAGANSWTSVGHASGLESFTDTTAQPSTSYWYRCVATSDPTSTSNRADQYGEAVLIATDSADLPAAPDAPTFGARTTTSVEVIAPPLPARSHWMKLQRRIVDDPDGAYTDLKDQVTAGEKTNVTGLTPGVAYHFRVAAVGSAGITPGAHAAITLGALPPEKPEPPTFDQVAQTSLRVTLPALPARAESLTLQMKLSTAPETAFANVDGATQSLGERSVLLSDLLPETDYRFRCVANGPGGSTVGDVVGVQTGLGAPGAPDAPDFVAVDVNSVDIQAPPLPANAQTLTLQGRLVELGAPGQPFADVATRLEGESLWRAEGLSSGATYEYRYVAVGLGGRTPGGAALVTIPVPQVTWLSGTPIECAGIRQPQKGITVAAGTEVKLSSFLATDFDLRATNVLGQITTKRFSDTCTYVWTAANGQFDRAVNAQGTMALGQDVRWLAPHVPGTYTLTLTVDDQNGLNQPRDGNTNALEGGLRDDAEQGFNDSALKYTISVNVQ